MGRDIENFKFSNSLFQYIHEVSKATSLINNVSSSLVVLFLYGLKNYNRIEYTNYQIMMLKVFKKGFT